MYQFYILKQMVSANLYINELWMHLGGLQSTQEAQLSRSRLSPYESFASFRISNLPRTSITQQCMLWCSPLRNCYRVVP